MSDSKQSHKINRFFAEFIAKLRKWLNKIGSPIRISRRFVRQLFGASKGQRKGNAAGFVLPTVTLVTLIVTLLVVTTVARSSDRAQTASNARTEQVFKSAATPIIDRARAKIDALLNDSKLPRTTPPEATLDSVITSDSGKYTLPDETRLQLVYDFLPTSKLDQKITASSSTMIAGKEYVYKIEEKEYVSTAWKFPIDTNNNGKFDAYGIYSILFRARPPLVTNRPIVPIEARALPMDETTLTGNCTQAGGSSNVASDEGGWTLSSDKRLKKSFFVYAVTVPITDVASFPSELTAAQKAASYELYNGAASISAVELQQDRARSQNNNAVFFEGDLELVNVATFRINGRIYTSGSLMVGTAKDSSSPISFYQVSSSGGSPSNGITTDSKMFGSCYYEKKNSEIVVAGQLVEGDAVFSDTASLSNTAPVNVDLFFGAGVPPDTVTGGRVTIDQTKQSVTDLSSRIALNEFAYNNRISALVTEAVRINGGVSVTFPISSSFSSNNLNYASSSTKDPTGVQKDLVKRIQGEALSSQAELNSARRAAFTSYFNERTRKVSFGQVPFATIDVFPTPLLNRIAVAGESDELAPSIDWMLPIFTNTGFGRAANAFNLSSGAGFDGKGAILDATNGFTLKTAGTKLNLSASDPITVATNNEALLGDRVLVGNGLPAKWLKRSNSTGQLEFVGDTAENAIALTSSAVTWNNATSDRYRNTRSVTLSSLGVTDRGGFWEISAALDPSILDPTAPTSVTPKESPLTGGLRVVTNAGIYSRRPEDTFLPRFRTGVSDITTTVEDESSMPLWNGQPIDNPITSIDETKFGTYVVWADSMPMTSANASDTRKGDLQMRATAIYHYKYDAYNAIGSPNNYQAPIACVSSYYDPSTPTTAKNASTAPWNGGNNGRSNNGLVYKVGFTATDISFSGITLTNGVFNGFSDAARNPANPAVSYRDKLAYQANLIFPNGRFANESLRDVITKLVTTPAAKLTLPQQSTLDSNLCALQILNSSVTLAHNSSTSATITLTGMTAEIPHGAFRESAFLDGREVKSLNRNESLIEAANGNNARDDSGTFTTANNGLAVVAKNRGDLYDLEMEQRQPLEIRATDIDIDRLRGSKIEGGLNSGVAGVDTDYLLPYSGLVYATREDALADLSYYDKDANGNPIATDDTKRKNLSSTDFLLDPTRRPSSIRLINGYRLWRSSLNTANLANVNGAGPISSTTYASFPWTETTKGEKGLTLASNLPVYVKAQYDPSNPTSTTITPSFNKHTREEFTQTLLDDWSNFYKRHAANGDADKLDPNFACRPKQSTGCKDGDEWRPATVLADAVTVLSANYRDGYRTDGDYDLRNNANTSTSINWRSQLNPTLTDVFDATKRDPRKDSSYVLDRQRVGLFNNNYITSSTWLNPVNSDGITVSSSDIWPGDPDNTTPNNGNLASYNANGVTPIQRRVSFSEYGMEICRKVPTSECTFSDWDKTGAGTTTLPDFNATTGVVSTPTDAPRYISDSDSRFARRLSFLRFDDIYKDGNQQLIFAGSCTGSPPVFWPMPIGVASGNLASGYTYPQVMGNLSTPFQLSNNYSYANVPCPETGLISSVPATDHHQNPKTFSGLVVRDSFNESGGEKFGLSLDNLTGSNVAYASGSAPFSMIAPPAAAYPFPHASGDILYRPFRPPSAPTLGQQEGGRYVWGDDTNGNGTLGDTVGGVTDRTDIFPNIPPRPGPIGEIPMLPGNFAQTVASNNNDQQMTKSRPGNMDRTLWYRTAGDDGNYPGEGENIRYNKDKNLFLNQLSFPTIVAGSSGQLKANLSSTGSLILPNTPCISLTDGSVDDRCISKSYLFGKNTPTDSSTTLLNLNLPYNPHFPSDNTSARSITSDTQPASSFVVCGATGNTRNYQAIERPILGKTDISDGKCAQGTDASGEAIRKFVGRVVTTTSTSGVKTATGGSGLLSLSLLPSDASFNGLKPDVTKKNDGTVTRDLGNAVNPNTSNIDMALRAINTYANNKVHVFSFNNSTDNIGTLDSGTRNLTGTITFRANCVDPITGLDSTCTSTSVRRGASPVFIMRGDPDESINFKGLQVKLDGVDPNNIFWISSRIQKRLLAKTTSGNFVLTPGDGKDPIIAVNRKIIFTDKENPVPAPLVANAVYQICTNIGQGNSSKLTIALVGNCATGEITSIPNADFALSAEPSFIFEGSQTKPNILVGNFLGNTNPDSAALTEDNTSVFTVRNKYSSFRGVRFLGLWSDKAKLNDETLFVAMTDVDQPALLPVLQLNVPNATAADNDDIQQPDISITSGINGAPTASTGQWTIRPTQTEVNVYFVAGSTPSRNGVDYKTSSTIFGASADAAISTGETGGGLANFVRFLENWESLPIKISGGFIQNTRSRFATAPWSMAPLSNGISDTTSVFLNPVQTGKGTANGRIATGYNLQYTSKTVNRIPFYTPPVRLWGYDVGLLTQQPDRFAERFAVPIAGANEYFREVNGDDLWVEALLCALEPSNPATLNPSTSPVNAGLAQKVGTVPTNYLKRALRGRDLRSNCNTKTNYGGVAKEPNYTITSPYQ